MTTAIAQQSTIRILDGDGKSLIELKTSNPERSLDQYCRNRHIPGARWEAV